jgi:hypothetical protein
MRRVFVFLLSLGLMTTGSLPAQTNHLDLKGKQIKLAILGVAGWRCTLLEPMAS